MATPHYGLRLDPKIKKQLKQTAIDKGSNQSAIVRDALNLYFQSQSENPPKVA